MAEEADALAGADAEESRHEGAETTEEQQQPKTVEALATELGWKPQDQWKGDGWQPAEDYLRAPREKRDHMTRELRTVRDQLERVTRTSSQILADRLAEKDAQLAALQARAVEDGKPAEVDRIVGERIKLKNSAPATDDGPPPETVAFMEDNKAWFGKDRLATAHAKRIAAELAQEGVPIAEQLQEALRSVKKSFPELFPKAKDPPGTQTGSSRAASSGSRAKGFADMPAESQAMAKDYLRRHGLPLEQFAASYWADEAKKQRRA